MLPSLFNVRTRNECYYTSDYRNINFVAIISSAGRRQANCPRLLGGLLKSPIGSELKISLSISFN